MLAILATVGLLSVSGYSSRSRDASRVADVAQLAKSLDLSAIQAGSYPMPDGFFIVAYSGAAVWYQGTAGANVIQQLRTGMAGGGLSKKPADPLRKTDYVYSTLAYGKAYQIKAEYEGDALIAAGFGAPAHAAPGNPTVAYVRGNYGGLAARTQTGSVTYVLAVPSIVTGTGSVGQVLEISSSSLSGTLLLNGRSLSGASSFNPNAVAFSGASLPKDDSSGQLTAIANGLKAAYTGSDLSGTSPVRELLATPAGGLAGLGSAIVGQVGGSAAATAAASAPAGPVVSKFSAGSAHTCALTTAGGVKCWGGGNADGRLGDGTTTQRNTPTDVAGLSS